MHVSRSRPTVLRQRVQAARGRGGCHRDL